MTKSSIAAGQQPKKTRTQTRKKQPETPSCQSVSQTQQQPYVSTAGGQTWPDIQRQVMAARAAKLAMLHNHNDASRSALYARCSPGMLQAVRKIAAEINCPMSVVILNAMLCVYPSLNYDAAWERDWVSQYLQ